MNKKISIPDILYRGTHLRAKLNQETIDDYAERMKAGDKFPLIRVYEYDKGIFNLARGLYRLKAALKYGDGNIMADVRQGDEMDAILDGAHDDLDQGERRTNADKIRVVIRFTEALKAKGIDWSSRRIADELKMSQNTVEEYRVDKRGQSDTGVHGEHLDNSDTQEAKGHSDTRREGKDGKRYPARQSQPKPESRPADAKVVEVHRNNTSQHVEEEKERQYKDWARDNTWRRFRDSAKMIEEIIEEMGYLPVEERHMSDAQALCLGVLNKMKALADKLSEDRRKYEEVS